MNGSNVSTTIVITSSSSAVTSSTATAGGNEAMAQADQSVGMSEEEDEDEDDDPLSSDESNAEYDDDMMHNEDITSQLASAGPTGMAAAAAISSTKKRKRSHSFETNPSIRKRQQTRLLRKLRQNIEEYSLRVGQQAVILVATPGKAQNNFRAFGAKPLEDVVKNLRAVIMTELETALAHQAPPAPVEDPTRHELPPLVIDGIPTPVEKMTQAQLRAFIPLMLKYSTGRGKPGWGKDLTKPPWWPDGVPWANVRMDARREDDKQKVSWTHALREIVTNCYKYHNREDLLPSFAEDEEQSQQQQSPEQKKAGSVLSGATVQQLISAVSVGHYPTVVQTISNADGTVSIVQLDPNNPIIQLPDGTTAQIQGLAHLEGMQGVHTLAELATAGEHHMIELTGTTTGELTQDGHIIIAGEDGQTFPVSLNGGMITVPVPPNMYQQVVTSMQSGESPGIQVIGSTGHHLLTVGGNTILAKLEPQEQHSIAVAAPRGLTITPVVSTSGSAAAGSIIQIVTSNAAEVVTSSTRKMVMATQASTSTTSATAPTPMATRASHVKLENSSSR